MECRVKTCESERKREDRSNEITALANKGQVKQKKQEDMQKEKIQENSEPKHPTWQRGFKTENKFSQT